MGCSSRERRRRRHDWQQSLAVVLVSATEEAVVVILVMIVMVVVVVRTGRVSLAAVTHSSGRDPRGGQKENSKVVAVGRYPGSKQK